MINRNYSFKEIKDVLALNCVTDQEETELIRSADLVAGEKISLVAAAAESVPMLWAWLEKAPVHIVSRFYLSDEHDKKSKARQDISGLSEKIKAVFKKGAAGAQIFLAYSDLNALVCELSPIRDDLFFNKSLTLSLNINEVSVSDWPDVFAELKKIKADAVLFHLSKNKNNADFVGRVYGLLEFWSPEITTELQFALGDDYEKAEQVWRLTQKMRPEIAPRLKLFIDV